MEDLQMSPGANAIFLAFQAMCCYGMFKVLWFFLLSTNAFVKEFSFLTMDDNTMWWLLVSLPVQVILGIFALNHQSQCRSAVRKRLKPVFHNEIAYYKSCYYDILELCLQLYEEVHHDEKTCFFIRRLLRHAHHSTILTSKVVDALLDLIAIAIDSQRYSPVFEGWCFNRTLSKCLYFELTVDETLNSTQAALEIALGTVPHAFFALKEKMTVLTSQPAEMCAKVSRNMRQYLR